MYVMHPAQFSDITSDVDPDRLYPDPQNFMNPIPDPDPQDLMIPIPDPDPVQIDFKTSNSKNNL